MNTSVQERKKPFYSSIAKGALKNYVEQNRGEEGMVKSPSYIVNFIILLAPLKDALD